MKPPRLLIAACLLPLALAACKREPEAPAPGEATTPTPAPAAKPAQPKQEAAATVEKPRLQVATVDGGPRDDTGTVEFRARYRTPAGSGLLHEVSRFERRAGRWVYVDGVVDEGR